MTGNSLDFDGNYDEVKRRVINDTRESSDSVKKEVPVHDWEESKAYTEEILKKPLDWFSDNAPVKLHFNALVLVAARTGMGKSTFIKQCASYAVSKGQRVLLCTNEMSKVDFLVRIERDICNSLSVSLPDAQKLIDKHVVIADHYTNKALKTWDGAPPCIIGMIEEVQPDIVVFDLINKCEGNTLVPENAKIHRDGYNQLRAMMDMFADKYNDKKTKLPPLIVTQQAMAQKDSNPANFDMKQLLRGSKNTIDEISLGIYLYREGGDMGKPDTTWIVLDKQRHGDFFRGKTRTSWVMKNHILIPTEGMSFEEKLALQLASRK